MFREFESTIIDDQGHFDIPADIRNRHGMKKGVRVKIEERNADLVMIHVESDEEQIARQKAAIRSIIRIVPPDSKIIEHYLEEKRKDREREDGPSGI